MIFPRIVVLGSIVLFALIGFLGVVKKLATRDVKEHVFVAKEEHQEAILPFREEEKLFSPLAVDGDFPSVNRIEKLFNPKDKLNALVETITYSSNVSWLKGRPAWISDYAGHYSTSRHFIARSLSGKTDYLPPTVFEGDKFNVFRSDKQIQFYLVVDLSRCKMGLYCYDVKGDERFLLKTYPIGVGKPSKGSDSSTPEGIFSIGNNVGIYNKEMIGYHQNKKIELIKVFGTRWLPFEGKGAKRLGISGAPWNLNAVTGELEEDLSSIGKYESDGCIRMGQQDVEELYAIIVTKPTFIEVVKDFQSAQLPGKEIDPSVDY